MSQVLLLVALLGALIAVVAAGGSRSGEKPTLGTFHLLSIVVPPLLILVAFLSERAGRKIYVVVAVLILVVAYALALAGLNRLSSTERCATGSTYFRLVASIGTLYTLGVLLQVRVGFQPNPADGPFGNASFSRLGQYVGAIAPLPLFLLGIWALVLLRGRCRWPHGHYLQTTSPVSQWAQQLWVKLLSRRVGVFIAMLVVTIGYALPLFSNSGGAKLTFFGIATSEWLRPFALLVLAWALVQQIDQSRLTSGIIGLLKIVLLVAPIAGIAYLRNDVGSAFPVGLGLIVMAATLTYRERRARLDEGGHEDSLQASTWVSRGWRILYILGFVALATTVMVAPYFSPETAKGRISAWLDPWQFPWKVDVCKPVKEVPDWIKPGINRETGLVFEYTIPEGYELCWESQADVLATHQSQIARVLTAVDGGGLWGRGLNDTEAAIVPILDSDFILAGLWSKFGGLSVLLTALLAVTLWQTVTHLLPQNAWQAGRKSLQNATILYANGLGASLAGQAVYVLMATVNLVPHSGIPFPFVSRGGQAMAGHALGIALLVGLLRLLSKRQQTAPNARRPYAKVRRGPLLGRILSRLSRKLGRITMVLAVLGSVAVGLIAPYSNRDPRNLHLSGGADREDVQFIVGLRGGTPSVEIDGYGVFQQDKSSGTWQAVSGGANPTSKSVTDLFGIIRTAPGGPPGLVDIQAPRIIPKAQPPSLRQRLIFGQPARSTMRLAINSKYQNALVRSLRLPDGRGTEIPGGAVVLDASSGAILALSSAPAQSGKAQVAATDAEVQAWLNTEFPGGRKRNTGWGQVFDEETGVLRSPEESECRRSEVRCGRYQLKPKTTGRGSADHSGNADGGSLPNAEINRAFGRSYDLLSIFEIVVAAAYLEQPDTSAGDQLPVPAQIAEGKHLVLGNCPGMVDGLITVRQALKVSCSTSFIQLAQDMKWDRIRETAERLSFVPQGSTVEPEDPGVERAVVPGDAARSGLISAVLGTGGVTGTPLQVAGMMATIANNGRPCRPYITEAVDAASGAPVDSCKSTSHGLSERAADGIKQALLTNLGEGGPLDTTLSLPGVKVYTKQGTPEGAKGNSLLWLAGFAEKDGHRPVAFAMVVEGQGNVSESAHLKGILKNVLKEYQEQ